MSHHIYRTKGFVIKSLNFGEANRYFYIFTKDLGLINATAQGVREHKSKLKYSLQDFSYTNIDLVKGKNMWRVINAERLNNFNGIESHQEEILFLGKIFKLLQRLLPGEDKNLLLFEEVFQAIDFLNKEKLTLKQILHLEIILVSRILNHLGYWGRNEKLNYIIDDDLSFLLLDFLSKDKNVILKEINKSLNESQL